VSPIASTDFVPQFGNIQGGVFNSSQMALLNTQISVANGKGIGVRYWDTPGVSFLRDLVDGGGGGGGGN